MDKSTEKFNIVFIVADQWRGDCLDLLNGPHPVMTPHLNQLAAEGVRFTQAYADCPLCMPQRTTMLTGQSASRFGLPYNFWPDHRTPVDPATSLPGRLTREAGYQTKAIGKMHFYPARARLGFEHITLHPNDYVNWLEEQGYGRMYRGHGLGGNEVYPAVSAVPESFTHTHWLVDESIKFLSQRDPDNPFFLWMIFEAPHSPFDPPEPYDRMYDNFSIPNPLSAAWCDTDEYPPIFQKIRLSNKYDQLNDEIIRETRRRYYGQISHIDYQLGRFLGELKNKGLYDNTIIIFTSDHGEHLGDHGLFAKTTFLRGSSDVPFIIRFPPDFPILQPALEIDAPVLTADICPTLLDFAGLEPNLDIDGVSLLPAIQHGPGLEDRVIFGESDLSAFAIAGQHKYIYYPEGAIEHLFDIKNDPNDLNNLAADSQYQDTLNNLRRQLIEYLSQFNRPMVENGDFVCLALQIDESALRAENPMAWRGPLRYGQGY